MGDGRVFRRHVDHLRNRQEGETSGGGQTFTEGPSTTRQLTPPQQQNEETRGREQPPNARDGNETVAAEAGGRDVEEESRGPEIGTEEPRRSTRIRTDYIETLWGEVWCIPSAQAQSILRNSCGPPYTVCHTSYISCIFTGTTRVYNTL